MFFQADNLQSSAIRSLKLNPATNQALVEYVTSAKSFLYDNIDADAIVDFFFGEIESAGKFVNAYCKGNQYTVVGWFIVDYTKAFGLFYSPQWLLLFTLFKFNMTATLSPSFVAARDAFAAWYDRKSPDTQELIDSISERTHYIIDEQEYDDFLTLLDEEFCIVTAVDFEDKFEAEFEGYGDSQLAEYAENMVDESGYLDRVPDFIKNHIDWEAVWNCELRYDYSEIQFNENTYLFRNHWVSYT